MSWQVKKLGEVCTIVSGGTPKTGVDLFWGGDIAWITPKDMGSNGDFYVSKTSRTITSEGLEKSSAKLIPENSVILSTRAPIGHLAINLVAMATNQGCRGIIPGPTVITKFLFYYLYSKVKELDALGSGTTFKELSKKNLESFYTPVPLIEEQKRIVAILDSAFEQIDEAKAIAQQNLQNAREIFDSALTKTFDSHEFNWIESKLSDVCLFENGDRGSNYPSKDKFVEFGVPFVNAGHIDDGFIEFKDMNYITNNHFNLLSRGKFKTGDILFCLRGSLGKFGMVTTSVEGAIASSLVIIRPKKQLSVNFLMHYLRSNLCRKMIQKFAGGAAQPNLGAKDLMKFVIKYPTNLTAQEQISSNLDDIRNESKNLESIYQQKITALDELKQSLLQQAFSGKLTANHSGAPV